MSHELYYTSAVRGLRPGEHGFCTVAVTQGIPSALAAKLESLCGYRHLYPPSDRRAALNPVMHAHFRLQVDGKVYHVLSRIADAGLDHTQRTNKFAHHVALERTELPPGGPAWALGQPGLMESSWGERAPQILPAGRRPPAGDDAPPRRCKRWEEATGDAGWAGVLAGWTAPGRPAYLIFRPGLDPLPLIAEALALLPPAQRWGITFSTYFLGLPPDVPCQWRCVPAGSAEATAALEAGGNVITLEPDLGEAPDGPLVESARTGNVHHHEPAARTRSTPTATAASGSAVPAALRRAADDANVSYAVAQAEPMAAPAARRPGSRFGGFLMLVLGLMLGLALMFLCILPLELVTGRSVPRVAGLVGKDEEDLRGQVEKLQQELAVEKKQSDVLKKERDQTQARLTQILDEMRPGPGATKKPDPEVKPTDPDVRKPELFKRMRDFMDWLQQQRAADNRPTQVPMPDAPPPVKPSDQPIPVVQGLRFVSVKSAPLELPKPIVLTPTRLQGVKREAKIQVLGMPDKIGELAIKLTPEMSEDAPEIQLTANGEPLALFQRETKGEAGWNFTWAKPKLGDEWAIAQAALSLCVLKVTQPGGEASYHSLRQPDEPIKVTLKELGQASVWQAKLPFPAGKSFGLSSSALVRAGSFRGELNRQGDQLTGPAQKGDISLELMLDGPTLRLKSTGAKTPEAIDLQVGLVRLLDGREIKVGDIRAKHGQ